MKQNSTIDRMTMVGAKIGAQRHLAAVRDGFISLMPLIMAGSLALVVKNLPIPGWDTNIPDFLLQLCNNVWWGTFAVLSVFAVFSVAYHLAKSYDADPLRTGFVAMASYFAVMPQVIPTSVEGIGVTLEQLGGNESLLGLEGGIWGGINWIYTSANSLFMALVIGLLAGEVFSRLSKTDKLLIKLPGSVPPAVGKSFSVLIPAGMTIVLFTAVGYLSTTFLGKDLFTLVNGLFTPLVKATDSLVGGISVVLLNQVLWCLGLHGSNIIGGVFEPLSMNLMSANIEAYAAGTAIPHIMTKPFLDTFVHLGGSGATLGLIVAIFITSKSKLMRTMGKTCIGPGLFNINEPVLFGLPVVLNPLLFIPFIFGPVILTIISYTATAAGLVSRTIAVVPWATPPILSGIMATGGDWRACVLQVINIALMVLFYIPFIKIVDRIELKKETGETV